MLLPSKKCRISGKQEARQQFFHFRLYKGMIYGKWLSRVCGFASVNCFISGTKILFISIRTNFIGIFSTYTEKIYPFSQKISKYDNKGLNLIHTALIYKSVLPHSTF